LAEELIILGTGAAEGIPALFCECPLCGEASRRGGKDLRTRASYQFGESLKVDWPPDSLSQMHRFGLDYSRLRQLLITHSHYDHFFPHDLDMRRPGFSFVSTPLHLYGNQATLRLARRALSRWRRHRLTMHLIAPGDTPTIGDYGVLALPASHAPGEAAMNFVMERDHYSVLLATDTGWWSDEAWRLLERRRLDIVLMDCTYGARDERRYHLGAPAVIELKNLMLQRHLIGQDTRFLATHFSHNGGVLHHQLEEMLSPHGVEVAYDGMRIPLSR
jgi:phosphoribosyl 1,2-cyclic phosphate phosphodiesterase